MNVCIGTSGYAYKDWLGVFYPDFLKPREFFDYYCQKFTAIEINYTFYRAPSDKLIRFLDLHSPENFCFSFKGPRYITHIKRLKVDTDSINRFLDPVLKLDRKIKCILWQLPPSFKKDLSVLRSFLELMSGNLTNSDIYNVFEFRNEMWFDDEVYKMLQEYNSILCWYDGPAGKMPKAPIVSLCPVVYVRFHGLKEIYKGRYPKAILRKWKQAVMDSNPRTCFAFFNNDYHGDGALDALAFKEMF